MRNKKEKGFTLVEFLVYIAVTALLVSSLFMVAVNLLHARGHVAVMEEVSKSARFITDNIAYSVRIAESVRFDEEKDKLILETPSPETYNPTEIYRDPNNNIMINRGQESPLRINSGRTKVDSIDFDVDGDRVTVEMTINYHVPGGAGERFQLIRKYQFTENIRR